MGNEHKFQPILPGDGPAEYEHGKVTCGCTEVGPVYGPFNDPTQIV